MRQRGCRLAHCHAWLKERRPTMNLQPAAAEQLSEFELATLGEGARVPLPPLPPNPLPRNDAPFGVVCEGLIGGPFHLPATDAVPGWQGAGR